MKDINMCKRGERMVVVGIVIENVCVENRGCMRGYI
jgi:hypothetical protein